MTFRSLNLERHMASKSVAVSAAAPDSIAAAIQIRGATPFGLGIGCSFLEGFRSVEIRHLGEDGEVRER